MKIWVQSKCFGWMSLRTALASNFEIVNGSSFDGLLTRVQVIEVGTGVPISMSVWVFLCCCVCM